MASPSRIIPAAVTLALVVGPVPRAMGAQPADPAAPPIVTGQPTAPPPAQPPPANPTYPQPAYPSTSPAPASTGMVTQQPPPRSATHAPAPAWYGGPAPVVQPGYGTPYPSRAPGYTRSRRGVGLMVAGFTMLGAGWLLSAVSGAAAIDTRDGADPAEQDRRRAFGTRLMIPVGGPFAAAFVADSATGALFSSLAGVVQVAGLALGIGGSVIFARDRRAAGRVAVTGGPLPSGGMATMQVRF